MREGDTRLAVLSAHREQDRGRNGNDDGLDKAIPFDVSTREVILSSGLPEAEMVNILPTYSAGPFGEGGGVRSDLYFPHGRLQSTSASAKLGRSLIAKILLAKEIPLSNTSLWSR